jgi:hypothetical protein
MDTIMNDDQLTTKYFASCYGENVGRAMFLRLPYGQLRHLFVVMRHL